MFGFSSKLMLTNCVNICNLHAFSVLLGKFFGNMDLQQDIDSFAHGTGGFVDLGQQALGIYGVDQGGVGDNLLDLIGLQVADEVPLDVGRQLLGLRGQLLGPVFPKGALARRIGFQDV